jgi:hypothetical protein
MWAVATSEAYNRVRELVAETGKGEPPPQNLQPVVEFVRSVPRSTIRDSSRIRRPSKPALQDLAHSGRIAGLRRQS